MYSVFPSLFNPKAKMDLRTQRFEDYVSLIAGHLRQADRVGRFRGYYTRLLLPVKRKSIEPMGAQLALGFARSTSGCINLWPMRLRFDLVNSIPSMQSASYDDTDIARTRAR